jgi:hypothetical protein
MILMSYLRSISSFIGCFMLSDLTIRREIERASIDHIIDRGFPPIDNPVAAGLSPKPKERTCLLMPIRPKT